MFDVVKYLKPSDTDEMRYLSYFRMLFNSLLDMFEWEGLPETIPARMLEAILHSRGRVCIGRQDENYPLVAAYGTLSGEVDDYSQGTEVIAATPCQEIEGIRGVDVAYGVNNKSETPDDFIYFISKSLGENDTSMYLISLYSRLIKIPKLSDEKDKTAYNEIIKKLLSGDPSAFVSKNAFDDEMEGVQQFFDLTEPELARNLQYLSQYRDDLLKTFFNFYGQPIQSQNKRAQSISDELHGMDSVSFILPVQMLKCREDLADQINNIFGLNVSVKFSDTWEIEFRKWISHDSDQDGTPDSVETSDENDPEPERNPEETEGNLEETEGNPEETEDTSEETDDIYEEPVETLEENPDDVKVAGGVSVWDQEEKDDGGELNG
jgi:hypothetical protein